MQLVSKKNFIILLAAVLVVAFGMMSMFLNKKSIQKKQVTQQEEIQKPMSTSDSTEAIEKDIDNTDIENVDKDLLNLETELNLSN
jgi:predicted Holliday junction resolvase-like endonuclease